MALRLSRVGCQLRGPSDVRVYDNMDAPVAAEDRGRGLGDVHH